MLYLDHLTVIAPSLADGVDHVRACLDIDIPFGTTHQEMGTHNHRLKLGEEIYLEVIALNPSAPAPIGARWFGLDQTEAVRSKWFDGERLRAWVVRTDDIDMVLNLHKSLFGDKIRIGQSVQFSLLPSGTLPLDGALPSVIDRAGRTPSSIAISDHGARLRDFVLEHPTPVTIADLYRKLDVDNPPRVHRGARSRYVATIDTPRGPRTLF